jgi:hypothetical protein
MAASFTQCVPTQRMAATQIPVICAVLCHGRILAYNSAARSTAQPVALGQGGYLMDLFEKCHTDTRVVRAKEAMEAGFYPYFLPLSDTEATEVTIGDHRLIMIGSNNYLGLTTHPKVRQAAIAATREYGTSCTGSRFVNGTLDLHLELEQ